METNNDTIKKSMICEKADMIENPSREQVVLNYPTKYKPVFVLEL